MLWNCLDSPDGAEQGLLFGATSSLAAGGFFSACTVGFIAVGGAGKSLPPELMVSTEHPAPQVSRGSPANRDVPLITVISAAPLPRSALSCSSRHSPATLVGMI